MRRQASAASDCCAERRQQALSLDARRRAYAVRCGSKRKGGQKHRLDCAIVGGPVGLRKSLRNGETCGDSEEHVVEAGSGTDCCRRFPRDSVLHLHYRAHLLAQLLAHSALSPRPGTGVQWVTQDVHMHHRGYFLRGQGRVVPQRVLATRGQTALDVPMLGRRHLDFGDFGGGTQLHGGHDRGSRRQGWRVQSSVCRTVSGDPETRVGLRGATTHGIVRQPLGDAGEAGKHRLESGGGAGLTGWRSPLGVQRHLMGGMGRVSCRGNIVERAGAAAEQAPECSTSHNFREPSLDGRSAPLDRVGIAGTSDIPGPHDTALGQVVAPWSRNVAGLPSTRQ